MTMRIDATNFSAFMPGPESEISNRSPDLADSSATARFSLIDGAKYGAALPARAAAALVQSTVNGALCAATGASEISLSLLGGNLGPALFGGLLIVGGLPLAAASGIGAAILVLSWPMTVLPATASGALVGAAHSIIENWRANSRVKI